MSTWWYAAFKPPSLQFYSSTLTLRLFSWCAATTRPSRWFCGPPLPLEEVYVKYLGCQHIHSLGYILIINSGDFKEGDLMQSSKLEALLSRDLSFYCLRTSSARATTLSLLGINSVNIILVAKHKDGTILSCQLLGIVEPSFNVLEAFAVGNIIDNDSSFCISVVACSHCLILLLPSRIKDAQLHSNRLHLRFYSPILSQLTRNRRH